MRDESAHARIDALQVVLAEMLTDLTCDNVQERALDISCALRKIKNADAEACTDLEADR